jgi:hypothetical protein
MRKVATAITALLLSACAAAPYKKADLSFYGGREGYLEKEIGPDKYILEYSQIGGYNFNLDLNKQYWDRRAAELCPNGYDGEKEVIFAGDAKIDEFVCPQRFCANYPLVSGVIQCRK